MARTDTTTGIEDDHAALAARESPVAMIMLDERRRVLWHNEALAELLGFGCSVQDLGLHGLILEARDLSSDLLRGEVELPDGRILNVAGRRLDCRGWVLTADQADDADTRHDASIMCDPLTGLPDRRMFRARLDAAASQACDDAPAALHFLDLDRFKAVNDTLGHAMGDALLRSVADRLSCALREEDVLARLGGDEFAILQLDASADDAKGLAERLLEVVGQPYLIEGHVLNIGTSIGVVLMPHDGIEPDALLRCADLALYAAKEDGRNGYRFFFPELDTRAQERRSLELDLRRALMHREFRLHFQPQLNLERDEIVGAEALLRWHHPERGIVSPGDFIPMAEQTGLIVQIGEWVLRNACRTAIGWPEHMSIAVNISAIQVANQNIVPVIASALSASGLAPERLELEITETVLMTDGEETLRTLHRIRELGVRISMDDFGTGYSSLSYLQSFPFDKIKIDQSFVRQMIENADSAAIVQAITGLGTSLRMKTIAEGVETVEQLEHIRAQGCTEVQGYLLSRPIPAEEMAAIVAKMRGAPAKDVAA